MNLAQRRHAADEAAQPIPTSGGGYWIVAGSAMTFAGSIWPRGAIVPGEVVEKIEHDRLALMVANRLLRYRLGIPPANSPSPHPLPAPVDPAVALADREAVLRNMRASGYSAYELDASMRPEPGMFANPTHPSKMVQPTRLPVAIGGGYIDG